MTDIKIGTSGYDYLDWKEAFYPADVERARFLSYYCTRFSTVELNFSYYRMPTAQQLAGILSKSEGAVDFSIKAHESLTHKIVPATWKESAGAYRRSLDPLLAAGKLSAVLCQFPFSFHYTPENRHYLDTLIRELHELPLVVEFRNAEWLNNRVFDALRERNTAYCSVDEPQLKGLPPSLDIVTGPLAYVRFHGRNAQNWWGSDAAARFDYLYNEDELRGWVPRLKSMMKISQKMRIYFNNHRRGQAPANAAMLKEILKEEGIDAA
jgi:uncharacterized protein YecE (DUF72 family)